MLYFVDMALKIDLFTIEMLEHSGIRFLTGFIILGISVFYAHVIKFKIAVYLVLALVLADDIWDYVRQVDSLTPEVVLHSVYMLLWGAAMGYAAGKAFKDSADH
ncbi:MAG: hypothetical protein ABL925_06930 [Methylococcales bacterium]